MNRRERHSTPVHHRCRLSAAVVGALLSTTVSAAPKVEFNTEFMVGGSEGMDLSRFETDGVLPGTYSADVRINSTLVGRRDVEMRVAEGEQIRLCLPQAVIELIPLDREKLGRLAAQGATGDDGQRLRSLDETPLCYDLGEYVPDAHAEFDPGEQVLDISIPHALLKNDPRGWVSRDQWDDGINALILGYSAAHQRVQSRGASNDGTGVVLNAGVNVGAWRFRHDGYATHGNDGLHYSSGRSFAQRSLPAWNAQLTFGDANTNGDLFDSVAYRGASVQTDPRMLPDSVRDFAPVVRGVARTNARVTIRQNGRVLQDINVAPGPYEIDDLLGTAYAGDLDVEVTEADGQVERFTVPFSAVPQLLRPGQHRFTATAGELRDARLHDAPRFLEGTLRKGINSRLTVYGGVTAADGYTAALAGAAVNTPMGAISGDITHSRTRLHGEVDGFGDRLSGQSLRLTYSKNLLSTRTNIAVAAYRYSTDGYLSLRDAAQLRDDTWRGLDGQRLARQRSRADATLSQRLGSTGGSLFVSASTIDYWNREQRSTSFSAGYSGSLGAASYSVSAQRRMERSLFGGPSRQSNSINLNISVPLGRSDGPRLNTSVDRNGDGRSTARAGINGVFGERRQGDYNIGASRSAAGHTQVGAGASYALPGANVNASVSSGQGVHQLSLGASGGVVLHAGGVVLSQQLNDTIGILEVPGAAGARVSNAPGLKTNARGMAVVPYLTPYRRNEIGVDPTGLHRDIELDTASVSTVPTTGAVVKVVLATTHGRSALIEAPMINGRPLPFGVDVTNAAGEAVGVVGQASRLWVRGIEERGQLFVRWGEGDAQHCVINYDLADANKEGRLASECHFDPAPGLLSRRAAR